LNQTFGGVLFDNAKEVIYDPGVALDPYSHKVGWFIVGIGNGYRSFCPSRDGFETYDWDVNVTKATNRKTTPISSIPSKIVVKKEDAGISVYFDDSLYETVSGGTTIGYIYSSLFRGTLSGLTITK
jgi:hypothetical protein